MNNELISVIVTNYNRASLIINCLESIKNQTYKNFECLIIDDGSTDNSIALITDFIKIDNRFRLIASEHIGFPLAKNIGLDNAKGEYVIFLDSDDTAYSYWLEFLYLTCKLTNADISTCYFDQYKEQPNEETSRIEILKYGLPITEYSYLKMILLYNSLCSSFMWNKLIKRTLYDGLRHTSQIALSDVSIMYKVFDRCNKVAQIKIPLVHYLTHEGSMTRQTQNSGSAYWKFRFNIFLERDLFIFNKYPQARFIIKKCLLADINRIKKELSEEEFNNIIDLSKIKPILDDKSIPIIL